MTCSLDCVLFENSKFSIASGTKAWSQEHYNDYRAKYWDISGLRDYDHDGCL